MPADRKSGLYARTINGFRFDLRFDVDGDYPQHQVSVTLMNRYPAHWIARLSDLGSSTWEGDIWYRHDNAEILTVAGELPNRFRVSWHEDEQGDYVKLTFLKNILRLAELQLDRRSDFFREAEFELDYEQGVDALTEYDTHDHPERPEDLSRENLSLETVYLRAGVRVTYTQSGNVLTNILSGENEKWNSAEMHDAMQANWSRPDGAPWSMWVLSAGYYENEPGYVTFGIMFDSIGNFHRNGTAVFNEAIENFYPSNISNRDATISRHKFRTIVHEIGHAFNLAHSWQKELGNRWHQSVNNEPNARSFMNYPRKVHGGEDAYWQDFRFRFSDQELLFIRHAPDSFVSMGQSSWFENHGYVMPEMDLAQVAFTKDADSESTSQKLALQLRFNRQNSIFEFLEPVHMELKLINVSKEPIVVSRDVVENPAMIDIFITRSQGETLHLRPYFRTCHEIDDVTLKPGEALYGRVFISSATNGWMISEPGRYDIVVTLRSTCKCTEHISPILANGETSLYVRAPHPKKRREEERLAQDFFADDVGRILALGGSKFLGSGNDILRELSDRFTTSAANFHAQVALALPDTQEYKLVQLGEKGGLTLNTQKPKLEEAHKMLQQVLVDQGQKAAETLGHIGFKQVSDTLSRRLAEAEEKDAAINLQQNILSVMEKRSVTLPNHVKENIKKRIADYQS